MASRAIVRRKSIISDYLRAYESSAQSFQSIGSTAQTVDSHAYQTCINRPPVESKKHVNENKDGLLLPCRNGYLGRRFHGSHLSGTGYGGLEIAPSLGMRYMSISIRNATTDEDKKDDVVAAKNTKEASPEESYPQAVEEEEKEETRIKDVKGGEEMTVPTAREAQEQARARVLEQEDDRCKLSRALVVLASAPSVCRERDEFLRMVQEALRYYKTERNEEHVRDAFEAYEAGRNYIQEIDQVSHEVSYALRMTEGIGPLHIQISQGWGLLDRDRDGKVTPDEVAAAARYLKYTLGKIGISELVSSLSTDEGAPAAVEFFVFMLDWDHLETLCAKIKAVERVRNLIQLSEATEATVPSGRIQVRPKIHRFKATDD